MSCDWHASLDRYVDSELSDDELAQMQAHLVTCSACAAGALSRMQLKQMTRATGQRYRATPEFRLKIEQNRLNRTFGSLKQAGWARSWAPVFAAAVLMLISAVIWQQYSRDEQALNELADLHVAALASANPVDVVSTDRHTVKPWFQGKLPFSFNLPELADSPFRLMGGRLSYFQQSPGAQLLFELRKHELSVFIFQNQGEANRLKAGEFLKGKLAFNSDTWTEGGLRYFVVGDCSASDIHALSELLKAAAKS